MFRLWKRPYTIHHQPLKGLSNGRNRMKRSFRNGLIWFSHTLADVTWPAETRDSRFDSRPVEMFNYPLKCLCDTQVSSKNVFVCQFQNMGTIIGRQNNLIYCLPIISFWRFWLPLAHQNPIVQKYATFANKRLWLSTAAPMQFTSVGSNFWAAAKCSLPTMEGSSAGNWESCSGTISFSTDNLYSTGLGCTLRKESERSTTSWKLLDWDRVTAQAGKASGYVAERSMESQTTGLLTTIGMGKTLPPARSFPSMRLTLSTGNFLHTPSNKACNKVRLQVDGV